MNSFSSTLNALIDDFVLEFSSSHTKISYRQDLEQFITVVGQKFFSSEENFIQKIERKHILFFRQYLLEMGGRQGSQASPKTVQRKLAGISSFLSFLVEKQLISSNFAKDLKRPKPLIQTPTIALSAEDVRSLLELARNNPRSGPLHFALLNVFFYTGLRRQEVINLKFGDLIELENQQKAIRFQGKGGKVGIRPLHSNAYQAITDYLAWLKTKFSCTLCANDWLFRPTKNPTNPGFLDRPLNPKTVYEIFRHYALKMGLSGKVCPHSARATFITVLLDQGADLYQVAQEVQHQSVTTTQEYDKRRSLRNQRLGLKIEF